jgi:hypothetical protein
MPLDPSELCQFCEKEEYEYSGHGIKDGQIYDVRACPSCYSAGKPSALTASQIAKLQAAVPEVLQQLSA